MKTNFINYLIALVLLPVGALNAQELKIEPAAVKNPSAAEKLSPLSDLGLSGRMYLEGSYHLTDNEDRKNEADLAITRLYLEYKKDFGGPFSVQVTSDVGTVDSAGTYKDAAGDEQTVKSKSTSYEFFIKNAFIQYKDAFGPVGITSQAGMIGTPAISLISKAQDLRWIYTDYSLDKSKLITNAALDTSADMGANINLDLFKMVSITGAATHGEGYKNPADSYTGKSYYGTISVNPYSDIFISGYTRHLSSADDAGLLYYGGGLSWNGSVVKGGINYIIGDVEDKGATTKVSTAEGWVHTDLNALIKFPVLIIGRLAYGTNDDNEDPGIIGAGGAGYRFNKNFRVALMYEKYNSFDNEQNYSKLFVKSEARF